MISGVMAQGFFVRLAIRAKASFHCAIRGNTFVLDAARRVLFGSDSGVVYRLGTKVRVRISSVYPAAPTSTLCAASAPGSSPESNALFLRAFSLRGVAVYSRFAIP